MPNRLRPLNVVDFTGGVNLRPETYQLAENELPVLLNMEVDPRGGLNTRKSWRYRSGNPASTGEWNPRNAYLHVTSAGTDVVVVANQLTSGMVEVRGQTNMGAFTEMASAALGATPHGADFASWGNDLFIVRGPSTTLRWRNGVATALTACATGNWQNDYTVPGTTDTFPYSELVAQHAGYMFTAGTREDAIAYPNRVRWSHPNNPQRWALADYIDIEEGGQRITAIIPFSDRLLIFKPDSVWALFGYDSDTWEVANISRTIGALNQQVVCRSEGAVFFLSWPHGIFSYSEKANVDELSVQIRAIFEPGQMLASAMRNAYMGWVDRRLWVSLPYEEFEPTYPLPRSTPDDSRSVFVWDPVLNSWTIFRGGDHCAPGPYIERIESSDQDPMVAFVRQWPYVVNLAYQNTFAVDECRPDMEHTFDTRMRTRWLDAGNPTWKKSWRRPDFLLRALTLESKVNVQVFHDYDNYNAQRSFQVAYTPDNAPSVWNQFTYGDGTLYGGSDQTSSVERGGTMGRAGTVQLMAYGNSGVRWGLNGIIFKFIPRRFR